MRATATVRRSRRTSRRVTSRAMAWPVPIAGIIRNPDDCLMVIAGVVPIGANLRMETPTLSLPLSGGGKSEPLARNFGLVARACRLLHLPLKGVGGRAERVGWGSSDRDCWDKPRK